MKAFTRTMVLGLAMLSLAGSVGAADAPKRERDVASLENSRDQVAWEARNAKGVDQQQLQSEERRLQDLIDNLQRGGNVNPSELDRTLNRAR